MPNPSGASPFNSQDLANRLHGSVAQLLTAAAMIAHVLAERLEAKDQPDSSMAKDLTAKIGAASTQLREIMKELSESSAS